MSNPELLAYIPLDGDAVDQSDGTTLTATGTTDYATGPFGQGFLPDSSSRLDKTISLDNADTLCFGLHFRANKQFSDADLNASHDLLTIGQGDYTDNYVRVLLDFTDAGNVDGVSIEFYGSAGKKPIINRMVITDGEDHSLIVQHQWWAAQNVGRAHIWLDGRLIGHTATDSTNRPSSMTTLSIGNAANALTTPADSVISQVFVINGRINSDLFAHNFHSSGLDSAMLTSSNPYRPSMTAANYSITDQPGDGDHYGYDWDGGNDRLLGPSIANAEDLQYQTENGTGTTALHDFGANHVVRSVDIVGTDIFVCVEDQSGAAPNPAALKKTALADLYAGTHSWTDVITHTADFYMINGWSFDRNPNTGTIIVGEYGGFTSANQARVLRSTNGGDSFVAVLTLPASTDPGVQRVHVHAVKFVNGKWYVTVGDEIQRIYVSDDDGQTWYTIGDDTTFLDQDQAIDIVYSSELDEVLFANDSSTPAVLLGAWKEPAFTGTDLLDNDAMAGGSPWIANNVTVTANAGLDAYGRNLAFNIEADLTSSSQSLRYNGLVTPTADTLTVFMWVKANAADSIEFGVRDTAFRMASAEVVYGPGSTTVTGNSRVQLTGLSTQRATVVKATTTSIASSTTVALWLYPNETASQTAGDSVLIQGVRMVSGDGTGEGWSAPVHGDNSGIPNFFRRFPVRPDQDSKTYGLGLTPSGGIVALTNSEGNSGYPDSVWLSSDGQRKVEADDDINRVNIHRLVTTDSFIWAGRQRFLINMHATSTGGVLTRLADGSAMPPAVRTSL